MRSHQIFSLILLTASLSLVHTAGWSDGTYMAQARAKYPGITTGNTHINNCSLCHTSAPDLNSYGQAFLDNGAGPTAFAKIENGDPDGDGATTLQEIFARTYPGDGGEEPTVAPNTYEVVPLDASWKYLDNGAAAPADWATASFNDTGWASGAAPLGYGAIGEVTTVGYGGNASNKAITTYFRFHFDKPDNWNLSGLQLRTLRNDGVVVYVNGTEVMRNNMPAGAVAASTLASASGDAWIEMALADSALATGDNVIAVELHQAAASGPDIAFNMNLEGIKSVINPARQWSTYE